MSDAMHWTTRCARKYDLTLNFVLSVKYCCPMGNAAREMEALKKEALFTEVQRMTCDVEPKESFPLNNIYLLLVVVVVIVQNHPRGSGQITTLGTFDTRHCPFLHL